MPLIIWVENGELFTSFWILLLLCLLCGLLIFKTSMQNNIFHDVIFVHNLFVLILYLVRCSFAAPAHFHVSLLSCIMFSNSCLSHTVWWLIPVSIWWDLELPRRCSCNLCSFICSQYSKFVLCHPKDEWFCFFFFFFQILLYAPAVKNTPCLAGQWWGITCL